LKQDMQLDKQVCLVTGATNGIGKITAQEIASQGLQVVVVSRNAARCAATVAEIREKTGNQTVDMLVADLSSQSAIRELAMSFCEKYKRLDVLVNNAGGFFMKRIETEDGIEMTWALNHLSYFLLTNLLLERLKDSAPARIINVSSNAHLGGTIDFSDLEGHKRYSGWKAYGQSKLANILFTFELARRLEGSGVTANAMHPGFVATGFAKNNNRLVRFIVNLSHLFALSPEEGARTVIYLATSPEVEGVSGEYFIKQKATRAAKAAYNRDIAKRLWKVSQHLTGLRADTD
jgi:NAD(P)-dependent dehydrogenase (short-subunit alcohol dehydrogenase family)